VQRPTAARPHQHGAADRGRIGESAKSVAADGKVGQDRIIPLRSPFSNEAGRLARSILVGGAAEADVAGAETLVLMIDGGDQLVAAELRAKLATQRQPVAGRGVERRVSEPVAIDAVKIGSLDASGP
jgi:hypothetical protein